MKSAPMLLECLDCGSGTFCPAAHDDGLPILTGEVGVLLGAGERKLLLNDPLVEDEPGVVVSGFHDVFERAQIIEAWEERGGQAFAGGVEPEGRRSGEDPDAVVGPEPGSRFRPSV